MLITRTNDENQKAIAEMVRINQEKLQREIDEKIQLNKNVIVMQSYVDQLEKERNNERALRLKLEEEYMTMTRNHEEEVELRLQFEKKLNQVNAEFRELEIKYNRNVLQLANSVHTNEHLDE